MASLRELKKHLASINISSQLAGAMKTVSSAKLSTLSRAYDGFEDYKKACEDTAKMFGSSLNRVYPPSSTDTVCYVVLAANRGLCGGYNNELLAYAHKKLNECADPYKLVLCGNKAITYFSQKHGQCFADKIVQSFVMSDTPSFDDAACLCELLKTMYEQGECSRIEFIYRSYENVMTSVPCTYRLLPFEESEEDGGEDVLFIPDRDTVNKTCCLYCIDCMIYSIVLEAAMGAAAATLMAMRTAYDNASEAAEALENAISRQRQSEVTSSVIETSSENACTEHN